MAGITQLLLGVVLQYTWTAVSVIKADLVDHRSFLFS